MAADVIEYECEALPVLSLLPIGERDEYLTISSCERVGCSVGRE